MPIKTVELNPANVSAAFTVLIRQPAWSGVRPNVIVRARMQSRLGPIALQEWIDIGERSFLAPSILGVGDARAVAVGGVPGASAYQVETTGDAEPEIVIGAGTYLDLLEPLTWIEGAGAADPGGVDRDFSASTSPSASGAVSIGIEQAGTTDPALVVVEGFFDGRWYELGRRAFGAPGAGSRRRFVALGALPGVASYRARTRSPDPAQPFLQVGSYKQLSQPFAWISGGAPIPPPGPSSGPESILWVAPNGSDATGARGDISLPFATIGGALAAASSGDTILVAPGTYPAVTVPAALDVSIVGVGDRSRVLVFAPAGAALLWAPSGVERLSLENITFLAPDGASPALQVNGSGFNRIDATAVEVQSLSAASAEIANTDFSRLSGCGGSWAFGDCNGGQIEDGSGRVAVNNTAFPARAFDIVSGVFDTIRIERNARILCSGAVSADLLESGPLTSGDELEDGQLSFSGRANNVIVDTNGIGVFELLGARIAGLLATQHGSSAQQQIRATAATIGQVIATVLNGSCTLDTRGGAVLQPINFIGTFYHDRDGGGAGGINVIPGVNVLQFQTSAGLLPGPDFPPAAIGKVFYSVTPESQSGGSGEISIAGSFPSGVDVESSFAANADISINYWRNP